MSTIAARPCVRRVECTRGIGAVLTRSTPTATRPTEVFAILHARTPSGSPKQEAETFPLVRERQRPPRPRRRSGRRGRRHRAILLLNSDFRGYQAIIGAVNDWANPDGDDDKAARSRRLPQEWVEQKMVEAVNGLRQLENGSTWTAVTLRRCAEPGGAHGRLHGRSLPHLARSQAPVGGIRTPSAAAS